MVAEAGTIEILDTLRSGLDPLNDVRGAATVNVGGTQLFATSSESQDRFSVFSVDPVGGFTFTDGATADGAYGLTFARVGGATFLLGAGRADDTLSSYVVTSAGALTLADSVTDTGALNLDDQQGAPVVIEVEGTTFVLQSGSADDGISVFSLASNGALTGTENLAAGDAGPGQDFALDGVQALTAFEAHGQTYVAAAGNLSDGIGLFTLSASGQLAFADSIFDSDPDASGLLSPLAMAQATIGGRSFLFAASDGNDAIATIEVKDDGTLKHQSNYLGVGTTRENMDMTVVEMSGLTFLLTTDRFYGTVTAFLVDAGGRLQRIAQRTDTGDPGSAHQGAFGIAGFAEGERLYAMVSAQVEDAVSLFEIGSLDDTISEGNDDDILLGFGGDDTLFGLGGNDRLYGMAGNDRLNGGNDNDRLYGGLGADDLRGQSGADRLEGGDGADSLNGGRQNDTILGQAGNDTLLGGQGSDRMDGGGGDDDLRGQAGEDQMNGGAGADRLVGATGRDRLSGGKNNDVLNGGDHNDRLLGGSGRDKLVGGDGGDVLSGGQGADRLNGGAGNDVLIGGAGADRFQFFSFRDGERDVIRDFEDGVDLIDIKVDVSYLLEQRGDDLLITFQGSGHEILFRDLGINDLDENDFV